MRLLHTSDWHLGRETYRVSRRPDHEAVIDEIVALASEFRPHLIIHSGDLFDGPRPAYDDLSLGADALQRLAAFAPVVVVCGNHDSPHLFRLFTQLLGPEAPIRFVDVARLPEAGGIVEFEGDGDERIRLASLPFIHANRLVTGFEDPALRTAVYADRVAAIEQRLAQGLVQSYEPTRDVLLFAAHLYVGGATYDRPLPSRGSQPRRGTARTAPASTAPQLRARCRRRESSSAAIQCPRRLQGSRHPATLRRTGRSRQARGYRSER